MVSSLPSYSQWYGAESNCRGTQRLFLAVLILVWFVLWFPKVCKWQRHGGNTDHFNIRFTCSNINAFLYFPKSSTSLSANLLIAALTAQLHMNSLSSIWYVCWIKQVSLETWDVTEQLRLYHRYRKCKSSMKTYIWHLLISNFLIWQLMLKSSFAVRVWV